MNKPLLFAVAALLVGVAMAPWIHADSDWGGGSSTDLTFERGWLESEVAFLYAKMAIPQQNKDLTDFLPDRLNSPIPNQYLASVILLHCNHLGVSVGQVQTFIRRTADFPEEYRPVMACIRDFSQNPRRFIPAYVGPSEGPLQIIVRDALKNDPALAYLTGQSNGGYASYKSFLIDWAKNLEQAGTGSLSYYVKLDQALDVYARIVNRILKDDPTFRTQVGNYLINLGDVERSGLDTLSACAQQSSGQDNAFVFLTQKTNTRSYQAGIPCVDAKGSSQAKIDAYRRLGLALRSPTFLRIYQDSKQDTALTLTNLKHYEDLLTEVKDIEYRVKNDFLNSPGDNVDLGKIKDGSATDLEALVTLKLYVDNLAQNKLKTLTLGQASQVFEGSKQCGTGLVKSAVTKESVGLMVLGGMMAVFGGPVGITAAGVIFVGSGVAFTGLAAYDASEQWESLDLTGRSTAVCNVAASAMMTALGAKATWTEVSGVNIADLKTDLRPQAVINKVSVASKVIDRVNGLKNRGAAETLAKQAKPSPLDDLLAQFPRSRQPVIRKIAIHYDYTKLPAEQRAVFDSMTGALKDPHFSIVDVFNLRKSNLAKFSDQPELYATWEEFGADVLLDLVPGRPKSLSVFGRDHLVAKRIITDSELVQKTGWTDSEYGTIQYLDWVNQIIDSAANSDRFVQQRGFTPQEIHYFRNLINEIRPKTKLPISQRVQRAIYGLFSWLKSGKLKASSDLGATPLVSSELGRFYVSDGRIRALRTPYLKDGQIAFGTYSDTLQTILDLRHSNPAIKALADKIDSVQGSGRYFSLFEANAFDYPKEVNVVLRQGSDLYGVYQPDYQTVSIRGYTSEQLSGGASSSGWQSLNAAASHEALHHYFNTILTQAQRSEWASYLKTLMESGTHEGDVVKYNFGQLTKQYSSFGQSGYVVFEETGTWAFEELSNYFSQPVSSRANFQFKMLTPGILEHFQNLGLEIGISDADLAALQAAMKKSVESNWPLTFHLEPASKFNFCPVLSKLAVLSEGNSPNRSNRFELLWPRQISKAPNF